MGSYRSKEAPVLDLAPMKSLAGLLSGNDEIGGMVREYQSGALNQKILLDFALKEQVECALVLASELLNAFGPRVAAEPECVCVLSVVETYCKFVDTYCAAAGCTNDTADLAGILVSQCQVYRARVAFNTEFKG